MSPTELCPGTSNRKSAPVSINSFKYGQTPNNLLTLRLTRLTVELDMSAYSIDAEEDEENEPLIDSDDEGDDDENSPDSDD